MGTQAGGRRVTSEAKPQAWGVQELLWFSSLMPRLALVKQVV